MKAIIFIKQKSEAEKQKRLLGFYKLEKLPNYDK